MPKNAKKPCLCKDATDGKPVTQFTSFRRKMYPLKYSNEV